MQQIDDARAAAVAALRAPSLASVARSDEVGVLRLLAKRNSDVGRARNRTACRRRAQMEFVWGNGAGFAGTRKQIYKE